ncbi:MAG: hypothetical protein AB7K63_10620 [Vicinamibacterales bacterium]
MAGAVISGVAMYAVGAKNTVDAFQTPAIVQTLDGQYVEVPGAKPVGLVGTTSLRAIAPADGARHLADGARHFSAGVTQASSRRATPRRTVYREAAAVQERVVVEEAPRRSWGKTALIIGGSAASGAGVGAIIGGKKGAITGAAIGGGAASIYEATRRR